MAYALSEAEKLLVRRALDKFALCDKRYVQTCTGFLNEAEQDILLTELSCIDDERKVFVGGFNEAERRVLVFIPEYATLDEHELIGAVRCKYYKEYELTHRDFLGAITGLGIEREMIGDIIVNNEEKIADIVAKREIIPFLLSDFGTAGRATLKVSEIALNEIEKTSLKIEEITDTVLSARLDAIVAVGFGMSRENATALVKSGNVYLNRRRESSPDKTVSDGATVNAKGYGKFKVYLTDRKSKKGRTFVKIEKYV